ncbi:hypothetical protein IGI04_038008 [Brassica rapa subsp. trilocularis]|uniref:Uncharacterized protein n=1 Tax=Brassica rapa subsp. trilocularis TaxID=1813537 RepID=A0ABQ7LIZ9_BRACM|nr:hypothetical protein IGI04_038008 [Brassica rapa subsp. trilocularis]
MEERAMYSLKQAVTEDPEDAVRWHQIPGANGDQEHGKPRGIGVLWLLAVETEYPSLLEAYGFNEI